MPSAWRYHYQNSVAVSLSLLVHSVLAVVVLGLWDSPSRPPVVVADAAPIPAVVVDEAHIEAELQRIADVEAERQRQEEQRRAEERRRAEEAERQRQEEQRRAEEAERQRREAEEQARAQQALAERLRQSARERLLADYSQRLQSLVERNWLLPTGSRSDLSNELLIQLDAEGHVAQVEIARSSGDRAFDRSAVAAVQRASPLPLPDDAALRSDIVRSGFRFVFKPEG